MAQLHKGKIAVYAKRLSRITIGLIILTIAVYILRGVGILTFIPGGVIYLLFFGAIGCGFLSKLARRQHW